MNNIVIDLKIREKKYIVSKYNDEVLDPELSAYIMNYMIGTDMNKKVVINISSTIDLTPTEEEKYTKIIKKEFGENIEEIRIETRKANINKLALLIIGSSSIGLSYIIDNTLGHVMSQVFTVFGWVALWEVAYGILFNDAKRKKSLKRYSQLYNSTITYK